MTTTRRTVLTMIVLAATCWSPTTASAIPEFDLGDMNQDGNVDSVDAALFNLALANGAAYDAIWFPGYADTAGDLDQDGVFDTADIGPFSALFGFGLNGGGGGGASIFISSATTPGSVTQNETEIINISGGGSGSLGIWVMPSSGQNLHGIDLNLRVVEDGGNAIDITDATVLNPTITGAGGTKRWFDDGSISGVNVESNSSDLVTGMIGVTTTGTSTTGEGTGLDEANGADDPLFDAGSGAYLFAIVDYDIINPGDTADLFLQISDAGIADTVGSVTAVVFGSADSPLDASHLADRNIDSDTADATAAVPEPGALLLATLGLLALGFRNTRRGPSH